jgi:hypothetical protein
LRSFDRQNGLVSNGGVGVQIEWHINRDLPKKLSFAVEYLDAAIAAIGNVNVVFGIDCC